MCHVRDNTGLYLALLKAVLNNENPGHGKKGYYLASPGSVVWDDLYAAFAAALVKRGVIEHEEVVPADDGALEKMAVGLETTKEMVEVFMAGK